MNPAARRNASRLSTARPYPSDGPADGFTRIPPRHGAAVRLEPDDVLTLVDPLGEQVSDLYLVRTDEPADHFSAGRTIDVGNTLYPSVGSILYSGRSVPLAEIVADSVGVHDLTLTPCSQQTFDLLYPDLGGAPHRSCLANLVTALEPHGVAPDSIGGTMNVFMDVWTDSEGELHIDPPPTRPGDHLELRILEPVLVGITACSAEKSNNGICTPIDYRVTRAANH